MPGLTSMPGAKSLKGITALDLAEKKGNEEIIAMLEAAAQ